MDLSPILSWAWERHHNPLSWYIRPLFLVPYCYFAYRRHVVGMVVTVLACLSSMCWFPRPAVVDPNIAAFLAMERAYLTSAWDLTKVLGLLASLASVTLLTLACWRRALWLALLFLALIAFGKMGWSVAYGGRSGLAVLPPALAGLLLCAASLWWVQRARPSRPAATRAAATRAASTNR